MRDTDSIISMLCDADCMLKHPELSDFLSDFTLHELQYMYKDYAVDK